MIRSALLLAALSHAPASGFAQGNRFEEQLPNYRELPDQTERLQQEIDLQAGVIQLNEKTYRITRPLVIDLTQHGAASVSSLGGATLIMDGAGPALRILGGHQGTASPKSFEPKTWNERMPLLSGFEIVGAHPEADGIELQRTVGAIIRDISVRWCRHGVHLVERNRNVIVSDCHLYENSMVGLFLDDVNLHQINVAGSHISYNRGGGVVVRNGNVRNIQISGCDIEGNMPSDTTPTETANVLIDVSDTPDDDKKSIAEISITGCTIQHAANYSSDQTATVAPGGANVRLRGKPVYPIDSVTISGNVLSDTTCNIDLSHAMDVVIGSNNFFAPKPDNLRVSDCRRVVVQGNTFNPRQFVRPGTIRFTRCQDCLIANSTLHQFVTKDGALVLESCQGITLSGLGLSDCGSGIVIRDCESVVVNACRVTRTDGGEDLRIDENCRSILLNGNLFSGRTRIAKNALESK